MLVVLSSLWRWKRAVAGVMLAAALISGVFWLRYDAVQDNRQEELLEEAQEAFSTLERIQNAEKITDPNGARVWLREYSRQHR